MAASAAGNAGQPAASEPHDFGKVAGMTADLLPPPLAALALLAAYLLGSLSGSLLLGRLRGVDIRTLGSGNAGGTNAFRTQGAAFAAGTIGIDIGKGALAVWLTLFAGGQWMDNAQAHAAAWAALLAATIGHVWPLWHGFRGGKGAATAMGGVLVLWPQIAPLLLGLWILCLIISGYAGLSTMLAGLALAGAAVILYESVDPIRPVACTALALLLLYTHRGNLRRMRAGTESRFDKARLLHRLGRRR